MSAIIVRQSTNKRNKRREMADIEDFERTIAREKERKYKVFRRRLIKRLKRWMYKSMAKVGATASLKFKLYCKSTNETLN